MSNVEKVETRGAPRGPRPPMELPPGAPRFLARQQVLEITGLCYATLWQMMQRGEFPRARQIGASRIAWLESEVFEWAETRPIAKLKADK